MSGEPDWVIEKVKARKRQEMRRQLQEMESRLERIRAKEKAELEKYMNGGQAHKKRKTEAETNMDDSGEDQFLIDDYDSDSENTLAKGTTKASAFSAHTLELMEKLGMNNRLVEEEEEEIEDETKVSICRAECIQVLMIRYFTALGHIRSLLNLSMNFDGHAFHRRFFLTNTPNHQTQGPRA